MIEKVRTQYNYLRNVYRDRANLQLVNRRLERKVKEMVMQMDEEQHSLHDQKDQVNRTSRSFVTVGLS